MNLKNIIIKKFRGFARVQLRAYLLRRQKLLLFGYYPGFKLKFIPKSEKAYSELTSALKRCRAFPGDIEIFKHLEHEIQYLPYLTFPDKLSIDVGANIGFYTALLAPLSSRVYAFEANPNLHPYLTNNLYRYKNVSLIPFAASSSAGELEFNIPYSAEDQLSVSGSGGSSSLFMKKSGVEMIPTRVPSIPVDMLKLENVGFIKIDVEGAELEVLKGTEDTLKRCRPNVVIENEYRHNPKCAEVFDILKKHNYVGYYFDRTKGKLASMDNFSLEKNQIQYLSADHQVIDTDLYVFNFLYVPAEKDNLKPLLGKK